MIQELLTDIELDVQQMKYMLDSISKEEDPTLQSLMKRMIQRTHERLNLIQSELESTPVNESSSHISSVNEAADKDLNGKQENEVVEKAVKEEKEEELLPVLETPFPALEITSPVVEIVSPTLEKVIPVLGESIWTSTDFRRSISLNDSFRFTREIFDGNNELMNRVIEQISAMSTYNAAVAFLSSKVAMKEDNEAMNDFLELLKKHFKPA